MTPPRQWHFAAIAALALAVISSSACNLAKSSSPTTPGGNGGTPPTAQVGLNASSLNFGTLPVGSAKTLHLTLTNSTASGGPTITVSQATASGPGFFAINSLPVDLAPGKSVDLSIIFSPAASGAASGTLTIDVIGASDPATVPLSGTGSGTSTPAAQLTVSPTTLAFGSVSVGNSKNLTGSIKASNADVTVSSAAWNGSGYTVSGITFPVTVQSGKSVNFTVTFAPQATGSASGSISFASSAANSPTVASFTGSGATTAVQHTVALSWVSGGGSGVIGYNVYRGTQSGGPYTKINPSLRTTTNYSDSTVASGNTYFYVATAVDGNSAESSFSTEAAAVVPTP